MKQEIIRINLEGVNCYLAKENDSYILFDTGGPLFMDKEFRDRREELLNKLTEYGCNSSNLKLIVLTHGDIDHSFNAAFLREKYQTKIAMHSGDLDAVGNPTLSNTLENCPYHAVVLKLIFLLMKRFIVKVTKRSLENFMSFHPDLLLEEGSSLKEFGYNATIYHIPGHTKGSIGILNTQGELICGDIFANAKKPGLAPNAINYKLLKKSVVKIKEKNIGTIYPGHGEPFAANEI